MNSPLTRVYFQTMDIRLNTSFHASATNIIPLALFSELPNTVKPAYRPYTSTGQDPELGHIVAPL